MSRMKWFSTFSISSFLIFLEGIKIHLFFKFGPRFPLICYINISPGSLDQEISYIIALE